MKKTDHPSKPKRSYINEDCGTFPSGGDFHEPPIGTGGGSLFVDIPKGFSLGTPSGAKPPFIHTFTKTGGSKYNYISVGALLVITELKNGRIKHIEYFLPKTEHAELHLGFVSGTDSDLVLKASGNKMILELTKEMETSPISTPKPQRPKRRFCKDKGIQIKKWALINGTTGNIIKDPQSGAELTDEGHDSFHFYTAFHDVHKA